MLRVHLGAVETLTAQPATGDYRTTYFTRKDDWDDYSLESDSVSNPLRGYGVIVEAHLPSTPPIAGTTLLFQVGRQTFYSAGSQFYMYLHSNGDTMTIIRSYPASGIIRFFTCGYENGRIHYIASLHDSEDNLLESWPCGDADETFSTTQLITWSSGLEEFSVNGPAGGFAWYAQEPTKLYGHFAVALERASIEAGRDLSQTFYPPLTPQAKINIIDVGGRIAARNVWTDDAEVRILWRQSPGVFTREFSGYIEQVTRKDSTGLTILEILAYGRTIRLVNVGQIAGTIDPSLPLTVQSLQQGQSEISIRAALTRELARVPASDYNLSTEGFEQPLGYYPWTIEDTSQPLWARIQALVNTQGPPATMYEDADGVLQIRSVEDLRADTLDDAVISPITHLEQVFLKEQILGGVYVYAGLGEDLLQSSQLSTLSAGLIAVPGTPNTDIYIAATAIPGVTAFNTIIFKTLSPDSLAAFSLTTTLSLSVEDADITLLTRDQVSGIAALSELLDRQENGEPAFRNFFRLRWAQATTAPVTPSLSAGSLLFTYYVLPEERPISNRPTKIVFPEGAETSARSRHLTNWPVVPTVPTEKGRVLAEEVYDWYREGSSIYTCYYRRPIADTPTDLQIMRKARIPLSPTTQVGEGRILATKKRWQASQFFAEVFVGFLQEVGALLGQAPYIIGTSIAGDGDAMLETGEGVRDL